MCGISGYITKNSSLLQSNQIKKIKTLAYRCQYNRGPDHYGYYLNDEKTVGLFHNRLSLVDLSSLGNQPMEKHGLVIVFNGEIYNFKELRIELINLGYKFFSKSDTEVILSAFDAWGESAFIKFNGPFAIAIYDKKKKKLTLARDKIGEKPLFYCKGRNGEFYFASSINLLLKITEMNISFNEEKLLSDMIFNFWSDKSLTHFNGIDTVMPGFYLNINHDLDILKKKFWDLAGYELDIGKDEIEDTLEDLLIDSINIRLQLDTKICSVLSGGIDSSFITKIAQENLNYPISTFTLSRNSHKDEDSINAKRLSKENNWINYLVKIKKEDFTIGKIKAVTLSMEEPILDHIYIYINRNYEEIHSKNIKAVLNGQGSDEVLLGYLEYYPFLKVKENFKSYDNFRKFWFNSFLLKTNTNKKTIMDIIDVNLSKNYRPYVSKDSLNSVLRFGIKTHMPALLIQEDKQSMAWSVECRTVYTDYRIVDLLSKVKSKIKYFDGKEKYLLRKIAAKHLPSYIVNRKKMAFPNLPDGREELVRKIIESKIIQKSEILNKIFDDELFDNLNILPFDYKWKLSSIALFESCYSVY